MCSSGNTDVLVDAGVDGKEAGSDDERSGESESCRSGACGEDVEAGSSDAQRRKLSASTLRNLCTTMLDIRISLHTANCMRRRRRKAVNHARVSALFRER